MTIWTADQEYTVNNVNPWKRNDRNIVQKVDEMLKYVEFILHMATSPLDILVDELGLKENKTRLYTVCI